MPPQMPEQTPLRVALDATPLLGPRTGVGEFCAGALGALALERSLRVGAFAVSWRRRGGIVAQLPPGVDALGRPMPARPLQRAWRSMAVPPIEWFTGDLDVVHGTNFVVPPARHAARVVTVHDLTTLRFPELCDASTRHFPGLVRSAVHRGAWVHTPSSFVAREVVELMGADPARVRAVPHGVPGSCGGARRRAADTRPRGFPEDAERFVLALGTVEPRKDFPCLVRAFDAVAPAHPDVRLVIAGRDGWGASALGAEVEAAKSKDRIVRLGYVSDDERSWLLARAEVFAYPSLYEGFGLPPLEAMSAGVPVVATTAGALPEVAGDAAELVPPGDAGALSVALDRVVTDEALRSSLVERGRSRVARFDWGTCAAGLAALYADAARDRRAR